METTRKPTTAEASRRTVRRATRALAALAIGATAAFAVAAASNTRHAGPAVEESTDPGTVVQSSSWEDDFGQDDGDGLSPPSRLPSATTQPPGVTSGGS
jgi:hypothetical protein